MVEVSYITGQTEKFKTVTVEITDTGAGTVTTYLWFAPYAGDQDKFNKVKWYASGLDFARPIWRIKKSIETTTSGISGNTVVTINFKPDASDEHKFIWNDYLTLNYV